MEKTVRYKTVYILKRNGLVFDTDFNSDLEKAMKLKDIDLAMFKKDGNPCYAIITKETIEQIGTFGEEEGEE